MPGAHDESFLRAALALARRGLGRTAPNPSVAALVVDESGAVPIVLGRGVTAPGGRPHAEPLALAEAGEAARGATLYVTLEPCAERSVRYDGPSCTDHILDAGISRVVIAANDPSPFAAGRYRARLEAAGVRVETGLLAPEAHRLNLGHYLARTAFRPFVSVKLAQTADGFAGTADRRPLAITGDLARARVHRMRATFDALLTGIGTILADDPRLDVRLPGLTDRSPPLIVLDTEGRLPGAATVVAMAASRPLTVATAEPERVAARFGERAGLSILPVPRGAEGRLDLAALLGALQVTGLTRVLVEAGPELADALAKASLADELQLWTGAGAVGAGLPALGPAWQGWFETARPVHRETAGADRLEVHRRAATCSPES